MSDEKNLSDDLNDMLGDAKEGAKKQQIKPVKWQETPRKSKRVC